MVSPIDKTDAKKPDTMMREKLRIIFFIVAFILLLILVDHYLPEHESYSRGYDDPPGELEKPGVRFGESFLIKTDFYKSAGIGVVTDIAYGELNPSPGKEIGIAGNKSAVFTDISGKRVRRVGYKDSGSHVNFVDVDGDGVTEFYSRGGGVYIYPTLIGNNGKLRWKYNTVEMMSAGDIDGDGGAEFVVAVNWLQSIRLVSSNMVLQKEYPFYAEWIELADTNSDGKDELLCSNRSEGLTIYDGRGNLVGSKYNWYMMREFSISRFPGYGEREFVLHSSLYRIMVYDTDGFTIRELYAPDCDISGYYSGYAQGAVAPFGNGMPEFFAVLVEARDIDRSILYLYDPDGGLVYEEVLPHAGAAIATVPLDGDGTDSILVGGYNKVLRYDINPEFEGVPPVLEGKPPSLFKEPERNTDVEEMVDSIDTSPPPGFENPGMVKGEDFLLKSSFLDEPRLGMITDIAAGELDPADGDEIGIAGKGGIYYADVDGKMKRRLETAAWDTPIHFVDVDSDGISEYIARGILKDSPGLFSHNGRGLWRYSGIAGVNGMAGGDVDGDGIMEFAVGFSDEEGIHLLDANGNLIWKAEDKDVWHIELVDIDGDGKDEIIHSNANDEIVIRDETGAIVGSAKAPGHFSQFSLVEWPGAPGDEYIVFAGDDVVWVVDYDASVVKKYDAPGCGLLGDAWATRVKLREGYPDFFAVIVDNGIIRNPCVLYVYNSEDELVFREILPATGARITAVSPGENLPEFLLVGTNGKVWRYDLNIR